MGSPSHLKASPSGLPRVIALAVALWVAGALLRAVPLEVLFELSRTAGSPEAIRPSWHFTPYFPGWSLVLPLQLLLAFFLLRRHAWSRLALAAGVAGLVLLQLSPGHAHQFGGFPLAAAREALVVALQVAPAVLLFLPAASTWFRPR
jgi:hypothetical protein